MKLSLLKFLNSYKASADIRHEIFELEKGILLVRKLLKKLTFCERLRMNEPNVETV